MPPSPSPEYKHFCRVCNKGFTCGSALGGHMRAHGAGDEGFGADDDSPGDERCRGAPPSDDQWDAAAGTSSTTHAYALRANPNRLVRSCQVCKNCGKEFTSWELFLEHGRCNSDDEDPHRPDRAADDGSPRSSSPPPSDADGEDDPAVAAAGGWSKGKRSRRVNKSVTAGDDAPAVPSSRRCTSGEEEDLANCLVMLSSSNAEHAATVAGTSQQEPCAPPASKEGDRGPQLLQPISFLAPAPEPVVALPSAATATQYVSPAPRGMFECKACKKVFTSHQALGGHRASHKKVKGCFAARFESNAGEAPSHAAAADPNNDNGKAVAAVEGTSTHASADARSSVHASTDGDTNVGTSETAAGALSMALAPVVHESPPVAAFPVVASPSKKNAKMHECSVCHRLFTSGQALGGHKRCHWLTSSTADPANPVANLTVPPLTEDLVGVVRHQLMLRPMADPPEPALDLTIAAKPPPLTAPLARAEPGSSSFHLDASAPALHLVPGSRSHRNKTSTTSGHDGNEAATASAAAEDEADSTAVKRTRLSDLKDVVSMDGEDTEPWLQVGIGSSSAGGDDKSTRE